MVEHKVADHSDQRGDEQHERTECGAVAAVDTAHDALNALGIGQIDSLLLRHGRVNNRRGAQRACFFGRGKFNATVYAVGHLNITSKHGELVALYFYVYSKFNKRRKEIALHVGFADGTHKIHA
ncbi:hypothetical protein SDC9_173792 [bioreactor metagenome]|uniref:Uncharacterized protein n=1 Tax=bioreactor metagenome TaxID=1076179 RepID=A0A645GHF8_9ZZZZ